ncbi:hypothetical protein INR49_002700 [Caranx melampygus]|nr:hypothetical protein INR49_002700 [Caranx melampygus]
MGTVVFHSRMSGRRWVLVCSSGSCRVSLGGGTDGRNSPGEDEFRSKRSSVHWSKEVQQNFRPTERLLRLAVQLMLSSRKRSNVRSRGGSRNSTRQDYEEPVVERSEVRAVEFR